MIVNHLHRNFLTETRFSIQLMLVGILCLIGSTSGLHAQTRIPSLTNVSQVTPKHNYVAPLWSPTNADEIAFAPEGFSGIHLVILSTKEMRLLTADVASGFQFVWAPDGEHIVYRARQDSVKSAIGMVNLRTNLTQNLSVAGPNVGLPSIKGKGAIAYPVDNKLEESVAGVSAIESVERPVVFQRDDQIFVTISGEVIQVSKPPGKYYLPKLSPDGTKVVYEEISRGIYVSNVRGASADMHLGSGNNPNWSPDGTYIAYERPIDDGHKIVSSSLYVYDLVRKVSTPLINTVSSVERHPSFSADGNRIAFDANGAIYVADFNR
jgi:Tol biopolymer transport system component